MSARYRRHLTAKDRCAKEIIKACVTAGAGIAYLPEAPRFSYTPANFTIASFEGRDSGPPSGRGSIACGKSSPHLKNWKPSRLDANPMYACPMMGDDLELTEARKAWADGVPSPLRKYLAEQAAAKRDVVAELFETA